MPVELQLVFEGKRKLLLYAAQDIGEIADKLGTVKGHLSQRKIEFPY